MHRILPNKREALLAAMLAVLAFALVKYVTPALAGSPAANASSTAQITDEVEAFVPPIADAQVALDKLPSFLIAGRQSLPEVDAATARSAGTKDSIRYWTALNTLGEVCLIALLPGGDQLTAMTCQAPERLSEQALALQFSDRTRAVRALVVPPGTHRSLKGFAAVGDQLLIGSSEQSISATTLDSDFAAAARGGSGQIAIPALDALPAGDAFNE